MPKATNKSGKVIRLGWYSLLVNGQVLDRRGNRMPSLPAEVAYSPQAKRLHNEGLIEIQGFPKPKLKEVSKTAAPAVKEKADAPVSGKKTQKKGDDGGPAKSS